MLPTVTGEFRVAADPELAFTPGGVALLRILLVSNSRKKNDAGEWVDDKTCWLRATAWRKMAETAAESLKKGDLVVVTGKMQTDEWEDNDGQKRSAQSLTIDEMGPSLRWNAHVKTEMAEANTNQSRPSQTSGDPWSSATDDPPFSGGF